MTQKSDDLPIHRAREAVLSAVSLANRLVVVAATGSGKSTQLPKMLLDHPAVRGDIVVLEPRRLAARMLAARVAQELGTTLGEIVGYETRHDSRVSERTRIRFVTDGLFVRQLQRDPTLARVGAVILDEFHERSVAVDVALGLVKLVQESRRPELRMIVTSATLEATRLETYLNCNTIHAQGRSYPVALEHLARPSREPAWDLAGAAIERVLESFARGESEDPGHLLVFMPGGYEIMRTCEKAKIAAARAGVACDVLPLHGALTAEEQDRAVASVDPLTRRRIIVSTNVAETSLTIVGVRTVIDSGLARIHRYDALRGLDTLRIEPISRASAEQRAGRAGRTAPGRAIRLWSVAEHERRDAHTLAEVARIDLASSMLETMSLGVADFATFPWLDPPDTLRINEATTTLRTLGALDDNGLTTIGRAMARVPAHPRLARAMVEAARLGCVQRVARIAAALSDRDPAEGVSPHALLSLLERDDPHSDALVREKLLAASHERALPREDNRLMLREAVLVAQQLARSVKESASNTPNPSSNDALDRALVAGFIDRIAFKLERDRPHCAFAGRRKVELAKTSLVHEPGLLIALEVRESGPDHDRSVSIPVAHPVARAIVEEALPHAFSTRVVTTWNKELRAVEVAHEELFLDTVIARKARPAQPSTAVEMELLARIKCDEIKLDGWEEHVLPWIARVRCVAQWFPERTLLAYTEEDLDIIRTELASNCVRAREVEAKSAIDAVRSALSWDDLQFVEKMAPATLALPRGFKMKIEYEVGAPPRGRAKIQDLYGLEATPTVASGRAPLVLEILGPNYRPLQVTQDLANFWRVLYPELRTALKRRYPRHEWR
ncbi:MAG: ATP-dependent helicase HrpB [Planctomycetota bacterium]|nr:MAG: ATP-dependent helicase HrpB [Planctomycetota bacterium]